MKITNVTVRDIRFPTSANQDGSDALNQGDIKPQSIADYQFPSGRVWARHAS